MKELIIALILIFTFSLAGFSPAETENPGYYKGPNYPETKEVSSSERCRDICQEIDESGACIKIEVRCEN
jgi:hypothetical protein